MVEYLDEELRQFLNDKEIYEINQYGWLIDDRPDPEYIGLAMWQTEPPIRHNKILSIAATSESRSISQATMLRIFTTGLDFEELMKSARHSIGLTCLYQKEADGITEFPDYHFADAAMKLRMATDRIRDFFIEAFAPSDRGFDDGLNSARHRRRREQHLFCRPFKQTRARLAENPEYYEELLDCLDELLPLIEQTSLFRSADPKRNNGKFPAESYPSITGCDLAEVTAVEEGHDPDLDIAEITNKIAEWYKLLIKTSNKIFLAEYLLRNFDTPPPVARIVLNQ